MAASGADCHETFPITSSGVWLTGSPFRAALPLLMMQITVIVGVSRGLHLVLRRFGQPAITSQLLTGLLMGPSALYRLSIVSSLFPESSQLPFNTFAMISFCIMMFIIGVKTDFNMLWRSGKRVVLLGLLSNLTSFLPVMAASSYLHHRLPKELTKVGLVTELADHWSMSSFMVISSLLEELNLLNSKVGRMATSASLVSDMSSYALHRVTKSLRIARDADNVLMGVGSLGSFAALMAFVVLVARPAVLYICRRTPKGELLDEAYFVVIVMLCLSCGLVSEVIGHTSEVGMFLLGLALPSGPPLGSTLTEKLEGLLRTVGIPGFVANVGLSLNTGDIRDREVWGYLSMFLLMSFSGKVLGVALMALLYCNLNPCNALSLGLVMAYKGIYDIRTLNDWSYSQVASGQSYAVLALCMLAQIVATTPLITALYRPSHLYRTDKKRTIQHNKQNTELRLLAPVHHQDDVGPVLEFLHMIQSHEGSAASAICLYVLHLVQLTGQAATVLRPYRKRKGSGSDDKSAAIMNAFRHLEEQNLGYISVQPFVSISPFSTMHDDVCLLAMEKKVSMVILPFHRKLDGSSTLEHTSRTVNSNVLAYAPCSVGILIPNDMANATTVATESSRMSARLLYRAAVVFIGGPDDREAISLAMHMSENPRIGVTVVRFLPSSKEWRKGNEEERLDDEIVEEFAQGCVSGDRVLYVEELVGDVEDMISTIRSTSAEFNLLIVGRREGSDSVLTQGLLVWSEYSELGVIGDMLASTDFETEASILVVQQQRMARSGGGGGDPTKSQVAPSPSPRERLNYIA